MINDPSSINPSAATSLLAIKSINEISKNELKTSILLRFKELKENSNAGNIYLTNVSYFKTISHNFSTRT